MSLGLSDSQQSRDRSTDLTSGRTSSHTYVLKRGLWVVVGDKIFTSFYTLVLNGYLRMNTCLCELYSSFFILKKEKSPFKGIEIRNLFPGTPGS